MCGIAGFINVQHSRDDAEQLIDRMCQVIRHRGPDDQGTWVGEGVALGMPRLSTSAPAAIPMADPTSAWHPPSAPETKELLAIT